MNDTPQYDPLIQALRNLPPAPHALSRERLLFEAGRAAGRPRFDWIWKGLSVLFGLSTVTLLALQDGAARGRADGYARIPAASSSIPPRPAAIPSVPPAEHDRFVIHVVEATPELIAAAQLRRDILEEGLDALPDDRMPAGVAERPRGLSIWELTDGFADAGLYAAPHVPPLKK